MTNQGSDELFRTLPRMRAQPCLKLVGSLEVAVNVAHLASLGHSGSGAHSPYVQRLVQKGRAGRGRQHQAGEQVVLVHDALVEPNS